MEVETKNIQELKEQIQTSMNQIQHPLHIYSDEYWQARMVIASRFVNLGLIKYLSNIQPLNSILDLACGAGFFGRAIINTTNASELWSIDSNPVQLEIAHELNANIADVVTHELLVQLGKEQLPVPLSSADLAVMFNSIYYLLPKQKLQLFKQVKESLRPGGRFVFNMENTMYWRNTHSLFPPIPLFWIFPRKIVEKILIKTGNSDKLSKFKLHHHHSVFTYLRLLKKAKAKKFSILLSHSLEYDKPLFDHANIPFQFDVENPVISTRSPPEKILKHFQNYQTGSLGDRIFFKITKILLKLRLTNLAILLAPRVIFLVQF